MIELPIATLFIMVAALIIAMVLYGRYILGQQREYIDALKSARTSDKSYIGRLEDALDSVKRAQDLYKDILDIQAEMIMECRDRASSVVEAIDALNELDELTGD